ncbi:6-O-methylguanine DNA methyltransferase [Gorgonomyces haynaldii]|nr:6-O-methylguanine DNA methyltransferase [Gorgonomyces haynaldii]
MVTSFQQRVYDITSQIPKGKVATYGLIANKLDTSPRAVGNALRNNPFAPKVPCHRVVKSDRSIGGFYGQKQGSKIQEKIQLLKDEGLLHPSGLIESMSESVFVNLLSITLKVIKVFFPMKFSELDEELPFLQSKRRVLPKIKPKPVLQDETHPSKLEEMQQKAMALELQKHATQDQVIYIRSPSGSETQDAFKTWIVPKEVAYRVPTLKHLSLSSIKYMEKGKWLAFPDIPSNVMFYVIDYLQRKALRSLRADLSIYQEFVIPEHYTLLLLDAALYFDIKDLAELCVNQAARLLQDIESLGQFPSEWVVKILKKANIGDMAVAIEEQSHLESVWIDYLWIEKFGKLCTQKIDPERISRSSQYFRKECLQFYLQHILSRLDLMDESMLLFKIARYQGKHVTRLSFELPNQTDPKSLQSWSRLIQHLPFLKHLELDYKPPRHCILPILSSVNSGCSITVRLLTKSNLSWHPQLFNTPDLLQAPKASKYMHMTTESHLTLSNRKQQTRKDPTRLPLPIKLIVQQHSQGEGLDELLRIHTHLQSPIVPFITHLDLSHLPLGLSGSKSLSHLFSKSNSLSVTVLRLSHTNITAEGILSIVESLVHTKDQTIKNILKKSPSHLMQELDFSGCIPESDPHVIECCKTTGYLLGANVFPRLQYFGFASNHVHVIGFSSLLEGIEQSGITHINLSEMSFATSIDRLTRIARKMEHLDLQHCRLLPRQMAQLFQHLSPNIKFLNVSGNSLDALAIEHLQPRQMETIKMNAVGPGQQQWMDLLLVKMSQSNIKHLSLANNGITDEIASQLRHLSTDFEQTI